MANAQLTIINAALQGTGIGRISGLNEGSQAAQVARDTYEQEVLWALDHKGRAWSFATKRRVPLSQLSETYGEKAELRYIWQLPADSIRVLEVRKSGQRDPVENYEVEGRKLVTDAESGVLLDYVYRPPESDWPPSFRSVIELKMRANFIGGIKEDETTARSLRDEAREELMRSASVRSQNAGGRRMFQPGPLIKARRRR
jgi:hypothetical protein